MKKILIACAALVMLSACEPAPAPQGECQECAKMAAEAKAKHDAEKKDCKCCHKGEHAAH